MTLMSTPGYYYANLMPTYTLKTPKLTLHLNPLPAPVTLRVTGARRVLVTAASRSCALASKLRL